MWRLGFFFHEMAFGLLSVFVPLYVVTSIAMGGLGGSLVDIGIMTSLAILFSVPASFFWGYICDRKRSYKRYILLSFSSSAVILFLFTMPFAQNIIIFISLYIVMAVLHVAHEPPKNVLVAEHYSRCEWEKSYALYEGLTEIGWFLGLVLGIFAFASTLTFGTNAMYVLYLCSGLSVVAFVLSVLLVADPMIIFERRLVSIEKKIDFAYRGIERASRMLDGASLTGKLRQERFLTFGFALILFSLGSSLFLTPLPIFFSEYLLVPTSIIFVVYMLNSGGRMMGYFILGRNANVIDAKKQIRRLVFLRSFFIFLIAAVVFAAFSPTFITGAILVLLGFVYAVYHILMLSLTMELVPAGKNGIFDVLVGVGAATGSFVGPYLASLYGFLPQFLVAASIIFFAFLILKISSIF